MIARLVIGLAIAAHGAQKLFGWFGGPGLKGATGMMESLGFRPGKPFALAACAAEIGGGLLTFLGLGGPLGPALIIMVMIVGAGSYHIKNGFFNQNQGIELNLVYAIISLVIILSGNGMHSLDRALRIEHIYTAPVIYGALGAAALLGFGNLAIRKPSPPSPEAGQASKDA